MINYYSITGKRDYFTTSDCSLLSNRQKDGKPRNLNVVMQSGAVITGNYRYLLWREWDSNLKTVSFVMLNFSRADAQINDQTITRCINFAKSWGYGRLEVVNLFAYRTSKPSLLKQATEPIGEDNDRYILESVSKCDRIILAWGNHGAWQKQDIYIVELLKNHNHLYSLGMTKRGCPRHPLYLRRTTKPQIYDRKENELRLYNV